WAALQQLVHVFAETGHDSGLGYGGGRKLLGRGEQVERALIAGAAAGYAIQARHGLGVVVQDVGPGVEHDLQAVLAALEVGDEHFDRAVRLAAADFADGFGKAPGAAEVVVIAIDAGDDGELESQPGDRLRDAARLVKVDSFGASLGHGAEAAAPGAEVAEQHEG